MEMAKIAQKLIEMKKISNGYKLVFNGGKYQSVKHIHWHLIGGEWNDKEEMDVTKKT
jgi:diadenosine tetraphosphate (Ap4A) HIT family hydrolase